MRFRLIQIGLTILTIITATRPCMAAGDRVDYLKQIKPLLRERCFGCHGVRKQESGLRLDTVEFMLKGGDSGAAIAKHNSSQSLLITRVSAVDLADRMPPKHQGSPLSVDQIALLKLWIEQGAATPLDEASEPDPRDHWAFQPIVRPRVPAVENLSWVKNPIDAFLARQHETHNLTPQAEASRIILLRRLHFDLLGTPPSTIEITNCLQNPSPTWYQDTVKRLLADSRHGERWARHWMDVWRYSEWWGLGQQLRNSQKHIWHWRDWIIESLNQNLPYDEMVRLMLAADELFPSEPDKLRATGYLARNYFLFNRHQWMDETIEHMSKGLLGLTMNCSKCHEHKYDPIDHVDYYRMRAFFEPYHVRLDMVAGESDFTQDAIPRVFDGQPQLPTYRLIRGNENSPDTSKVIEPGIPEFLAFGELKIEPVNLPADASQPERRPWVANAYLDTATKATETAQSKVDQAQKAFAAAEKTKAVFLARMAAKPKSDAGKTATNSKPSASSPLLHDRFSTLNESHWKLFGGKWSHSPGKLEQQQDGATKAALHWLGTPPRDFDVTVRFTIKGGSKWRSVSLAYDGTQIDPSTPMTDSDSGQSVYVSGYAGGPKVQAAYHRGGTWQYPAAARQSQPIKLNREYTFRVQVRDTLINASLDGQPVLQWRTPMARRNGALQLTTFDVLAVFHEVSITPLSELVKLREPSSTPNTGEPNSVEAATTAVAMAKASLGVTQAELAVAIAEKTSLTHRIAALQDRWKLEDSDSTQLKARSVKSHAKAVQAERAASVSKAALAVAKATLAAVKAGGDKNSATGKAIATAQSALKKSYAAASDAIKPDDHYAGLTGAKWTPTRFLFSGKDDPTVPFPVQSTGRRTALAKWITDPRNPLTARVAVNHIWMRHMGAPLVPTVFDFGRNGLSPTHPELLDWLAAEFIDSGWSMKHIHSLIVSSAAYRMSSSLDGGNKSASADPQNRYWWRRIPIRLESQAIRDAVLTHAGTIDLTIGGAPVLPAQQAASRRRSLYFFHSNNSRNIFLATFDEALVTACYRREQSIVPQQALALVNSSFVLDASKTIAKRLGEGITEDTQFIRYAFSGLLGIEASALEMSKSERALRSWESLPNGSVDNARAHLVWVLINHNDFVTLR